MNPQIAQGQAAIIPASNAGFSAGNNLWSVQAPGGAMAGNNNPGPTNGWSVSWIDATHLQVTVPAAAAVGIGYTANFVSGATLFTGLFDVIAAPPRVTLTATPASIFQGDVSVLSWTSAFATSLSIDQGIGAVAVPGGSDNVSPVQTTIYTITAAGPGGVATASAVVAVRTQYHSPADPPSAWGGGPACNTTWANGPACNTTWATGPAGGS